MINWLRLRDLISQETLTSPITLSANFELLSDCVQRNNTNAYHILSFNWTSPCWTNNFKSFHSRVVLSHCWYKQVSSWKLFTIQTFTFPWFTCYKIDENIFDWVSFKSGKEENLERNKMENSNHVFFELGWLFTKIGRRLYMCFSAWKYPLLPLSAA